VLAERAMRALGHEKTLGSGWAGAGSFRDLLAESLPEDIRLTGQPPYFAFDVRRGIPVEAAPAGPRHGSDEEARLAPSSVPPAASAAPTLGSIAPAAAPVVLAGAPVPSDERPALPPLGQIVPPPSAGQGPSQSPRQPQVEATIPPQVRSVQQQHQPQARSAESATALQQSIARIHDACQAPPLSPPEYRALFEIIAHEINASGLKGAQTLTNILTKTQEMGVDIRHDDVRFVLEVVSEADPWFQQGASANLFAGRFRNFVVARCRSQGLNLSAEELDLIDAWFAGAGSASAQPPSARPAISAPQVSPAPAASQGHEVVSAPPFDQAADRWWGQEGERQTITEAGDQRLLASGLTPRAANAGAFQGGTDEFPTNEEFPRIVRTRLRG
jgi:hypothetical protein